MESLWKEELNKMLSKDGWFIDSAMSDIVLTRCIGSKRVWKRGKIIEKPVFQKKRIRDKGVIQMIDFLAMLEFFGKQDIPAFKNTLMATYEAIIEILNKRR